MFEVKLLLFICDERHIRRRTILRIILIHTGATEKLELGRHSKPMLKDWEFKKKDMIVIRSLYDSAPHWSHKLANHLIIPQ